MPQKKSASEEIAVLRKDLEASIAAVKKTYPPIDRLGIKAIKEGVEEYSSWVESLRERSVIKRRPPRPKEALLNSIDEYKALADFYYSYEAEKSRRQRPTHIVADEIEVIFRKARALKSALLDYFQTLLKALPKR